MSDISSHFVYILNCLTIAGFLYMSDFLHQWLTATQYIAPLMANFDTQIGNNSLIHYMDNGEKVLDGNDWVYYSLDYQQLKDLGLVKSMDLTFVPSF